MIRFYKDAINIVTVTLKENSTISDPIYLFKFVSQQTLVNYYFISQDISQFKQRYNQFGVTEIPELTSPNDTLDGVISLGKEGFYDYYIYETSLTNTFGLNSAIDAIPYIVKEVETGLVDVVLSSEIINEYNEVDNTSIVYQP